MLRASRQDAEAKEGAVPVSGAANPVPVAGVLTRPGQRAAEERDQVRRQEEPLPAEVPGVHVPQFVGDDHVPRRRVVAAGPEEVRVQHDDRGTEEAGREGVEIAAK